MPSNGLGGLEKVGWVVVHVVCALVKKLHGFSAQLGSALSFLFLLSFLCIPWEAVCGD